MQCYENECVSERATLVSDPHSLNGAHRDLLSCHALVYLDGAFWEGEPPCALWCNSAAEPVAGALKCLNRGVGGFTSAGV